MGKYSVASLVSSGYSLKRRGEGGLALDKGISTNMQGGSGGMLPWEILKFESLEMAGNAPEVS